MRFDCSSCLACCLTQRNLFPDEVGDCDACPRLDQVAGRCRDYENRKQGCRDLVNGGSECLMWRRKLGKEGA